MQKKKKKNPQSHWEGGTEGAWRETVRKQEGRRNSEETQRRWTKQNERRVICRWDVGICGTWIRKRHKLGRLQIDRAAKKRPVKNNEGQILFEWDVKQKLKQSRFPWRPTGKRKMGKLLRGMKMFYLLKASTIWQFSLLFQVFDGSLTTSPPSIIHHTGPMSTKGSVARWETNAPVTQSNNPGCEKDLDWRCWWWPRRANTTVQSVHIQHTHKHTLRQEGWSLLHKVLVWHAGLPIMIYDPSSKVSEMNVAARTDSICDLWPQSDPWTADYSPGASGWTYMCVVCGSSYACHSPAFNDANLHFPPQKTQTHCFCVPSIVSEFTLAVWEDYFDENKITQSALLWRTPHWPFFHSWIICPVFKFYWRFRTFGFCLVLSAIC